MEKAILIFVPMIVFLLILVLGMNDISNHHQQRFMERCTQSARYVDCQSDWKKDGSP